jgi:beta-xylosidase
MYKSLITFLLCCLVIGSKAQVWVPDNGDGTYKNPIIYADYSDPDVIRVGDDYYMVASSFNCQPGIPVLHSKDLVNWKIINHVYDHLPLQRYQKMQAGQGSWAPSIRYHNGRYYVYFCTPEDGLFMASAVNPAGKWTLALVQDVANWEDPCPFWDTDGHAYLLHGRKGAGPAILHKMSADGKKLLDNGRLIYRDDKQQPTLEGFKFLNKRAGYYYFMAPAGGVGTGWQSVFRSKNIYGPYEDKIVLRQGSTGINGPHQGGLVETQTGEWWFIHFQEKGAYGRILYLQPAVWKNGWPVIGEDKDGNGTGEPILTYKMPNVGKHYPAGTPQTSDEFSSPVLGLQWQWQAAPHKNWYSLISHKGFIRLNAMANPTNSGSLFYAPNMLLQKFMAPAFTVTAKLIFHSATTNDRAGLTITGNYYTFLCLEKQENGNSLVIYEGKADNRRLLPPRPLASIPVKANTVWLRATVNDKAMYRYTYSLDGVKFMDIGDEYHAEKGTWIGAKTGLVCLNPSLLPSKGYADVDFFRVTL